MSQQGVIIPQAATPSFPGCALSCTTLLQARDVCMPPNVLQSSQLTYDQCFCSSPFLTPFATTTDGVCVTECTIQTDRQLLQAWYNNFCAQVRQGIDPTTQTQTSSTTTTPPAAATSTQYITSGTFTATGIPTPTPTPSSTSTTGASSNTSHQNQTWIQGHWKYVLMLGILAVGLILLAWLAVWLKRRHRRNLEAKRAAASGFNYDPEKRPANDPRRSATPDLWGPHQMMQATQGYGYTTETPEDKPMNGGTQKYRGANTKRLTKEAIEIVDTGEGTSSRPSIKRARPSELEINARMIGAADRRSKSRGKSSQGPNDKDVEAAQLEQSKVKSKRAERDCLIPSWATTGPEDPHHMMGMLRSSSPNQLGTNLEIYELADKYGCSKLGDLARDNVARSDDQCEIGTLQIMAAQRSVEDWRDLINKNDQLKETFAPEFATRYKQMKRRAEIELKNGCFSGYIDGEEEDESESMTRATASLYLGPEGRTEVELKQDTKKKETLNATGTRTPMNEWLD